MSFTTGSFSTETLEDGTLLVVVSGELDLASAPRLQSTLTTALSGGTDRVVIDLRAAPFVDSSGIGAIVAGYAEAVEGRASFAIAAGDGYAAQRLRMMGLDALLAIWQRARGWARAGL